MNHRDAEDVKEARKEGFHARNIEAVKNPYRSALQQRPGWKQSVPSACSVSISGSNYLTNCFISIYHAVVLPAILDGSSSYW